MSVAEGGVLDPPQPRRFECRRALLVWPADTLRGKPSAVPLGNCWRDGIAALLLGVVAFVAHVASPIRTSFDSRWAIHTAVSLVYRGDADLDEYEPLLAIEED